MAPNAALAVLIMLVAATTTAIAAAPQTLLLRGEAAAQALKAAAAAVVNSSSSAAAALASGVDPPSAWKISTRSPYEVSELRRTLRIDPDLAYLPGLDIMLYTCSLGGGGGDHGGGDHGLDGHDHDHRQASSSPSAAVEAAGRLTSATDGFVFPLDADPSAEDAFKLHSRPGAPKMIVLDFTGHTLRAGTAWSFISKIGDVPIVTPPWDRDGDPISFSKAEREEIISIWRHVAEHWAAWNVDVTTEEPTGTDDEADAALGQGVGIRVVTRNIELIEWMLDEYANSTAGIAYLDSFGEPLFGPIVFNYQTLLSATADTATHEIGHSLGLRHHGNLAEPDGTLEQVYYSGHGFWAPLMGYFYDRPFVTWSRGDYPYATQPAQDDIAIISAQLAASSWLGGGQDSASAEPLAPPLDAVSPTSVNGVFSSRKQQLFYRFKAGKAGKATVSLAVTSNDAQGELRTLLAAQLRVYTADTGANVGGGPVSNVGPPLGVGRTVINSAVDVVAGLSYIIEISAARWEDASTGFTEYSAFGTFALSLSQSETGVVVPAAAGPDPLPPARCRGLTLLQLSRAAGNCESSGWAVRAEDVFAPASPDNTAGVTPALGTVVAAGASALFVVALASGGSCTTRVSVAPCIPPGAYRITCPPPKTPYATLGAPSCDTAPVRPRDLYRVWQGDEDVSDVVAVTSTLPDGNVLPAGLFYEAFFLPADTLQGDPYCGGYITIQPCTPVPLPPGVEVRLKNYPGTCSAIPSPASVFINNTVSFSGQVIARAFPGGPLLPLPIKTGLYYFEVVYPSLVAVAPTFPSAVKIVVLDAEAPYAAIKDTVARYADGRFICARGANRRARKACVSIGGGTDAGILNIEDNCGTAGLARRFSCRGKGCVPAKSTATKLCVQGLKAGKGRIEATYTMHVTDMAGNKAEPLKIPIAAWHFSDAGGAACFKG